MYKFSCIYYSFFITFRSFLPEYSGSHPRSIIGTALLIILEKTIHKGRNSVNFYILQSADHLCLLNVCSLPSRADQCCQVSASFTVQFGREKKFGQSQKDFGTLVSVNYLILKLSSKNNVMLNMYLQKQNS